MNTIKKITGVLVFIFFTQVILLAQKTSTKNVDQIAAGIVEKLSKEVALTDSQKVVILEHAKAFALKSQNTKNLSNNEVTLMQRKSNVQEYKAAINEVLTNEQKEMLVKKHEERREAVVKKYTTTQK